jgi:hypothetical protein
MRRDGESRAAWVARLQERAAGNRDAAARTAITLHDSRTMLSVPQAQALARLQSTHPGVLGTISSLLYMLDAPAADPNHAVYRALAGHLSTFFAYYVAVMDVASAEALMDTPALTGLASRNLTSRPFQGPNAFPIREQLRSKLQELQDSGRVSYCRLAADLLHPKDPASPHLGALDKLRRSLGGDLVLVRSRAEARVVQEVLGTWDHPPRILAADEGRVLDGDGMDAHVPNRVRPVGELGPRPELRSAAGMDGAKRMRGAAASLERLAAAVEEAGLRGRAVLDAKARVAEAQRVLDIEVERQRAAEAEVGALGPRTPAVKRKGATAPTSQGRVTKARMEEGS